MSTPLIDKETAQACVRVNFRYLQSDAINLRHAAQRLNQIASGAVVERTDWCFLAQAKTEHDTIAIECLMSFARMVDPDFHQ